MKRSIIAGFCLAAILLIGYKIYGGTTYICTAYGERLQCISFDDPYSSEDQSYDCPGDPRCPRSTPEEFSRQEAEEGDDRGFVPGAAETERGSEGRRNASEAGGGGPRAAHPDEGELDTDAVFRDAGLGGHLYTEEEWNSMFAGEGEGQPGTGGVGGTGGEGGARGGTAFGAAADISLSENVHCGDGTCSVLELHRGGCPADCGQVAEAFAEALGVAAALPGLVQSIRDTQSWLDHREWVLSEAAGRASHMVAEGFRRVNLSSMAAFVEEARLRGSMKSGAITAPAYSGPQESLLPAGILAANRNLTGERVKGETSGDPVDIGTGNFCYDETLAVREVNNGPPLNVSAAYCHQNPVPQGALGPGWALNVESTLFDIGDEILYQTPEGLIIHFEESDQVGIFHAVGVPLKIQKRGYDYLLMGIEGPIAGFKYFPPIHLETNTPGFTEQQGRGSIWRHLYRTTGLTVPFLGELKETAESFVNETGRRLNSLNRQGREEWIQGFVPYSKLLVSQRYRPFIPPGGEGDYDTGETTQAIMENLPPGVWQPQYEQLSQPVGMDHIFSLRDQDRITRAWWSSLSRGMFIVDPDSSIFPPEDSEVSPRVDKNAEYLSWISRGLRRAPVVWWSDPAGRRTHVRRRVLWHTERRAVISGTETGAWIDSGLHAAFVEDMTGGVTNCYVSICFAEGGAGEYEAEAGSCAPGGWDDVAEIGSMLLGCIPFELGWAYLGELWAEWFGDDYSDPKWRMWSTLYETRIPKEMEVVLSGDGGERQETLHYEFRLEEMPELGEAYAAANIHHAPLLKREKDRYALKVLRPRPILKYIEDDRGYRTELKYNYVTGTDIHCPLSLADVTGQSYLSFRLPSSLPFLNDAEMFRLEELVADSPGCHLSNNCRVLQFSNDEYRHTTELRQTHGMELDRGEDSPGMQNCDDIPLLGLITEGGGFEASYAGPLVLSRIHYPGVVSGGVGNADSPDSHIFSYEMANPQGALEDRMFGLRMTAVGYRTATSAAHDAIPTHDAVYIRNSYYGVSEEDKRNKRDNNVSSHELGNTGSIFYTPISVGNEKHVLVNTRGQKSWMYRFDQNGRLFAVILNPASDALTTSYEYGGNNQLTAVVMPGGLRTEYDYFNEGGFFSRFMPQSVRRIGGEEGEEEIIYHYDLQVGPQLGFFGKISEIISRSPASDDETITTRYTYDYQEPQLNPCNAGNPQGNLVRIDYPDGSFEAFTHNKQGKILEHRLRNRRVDRYTYEPFADAALNCNVHGILGGYQP